MENDSIEASCPEEILTHAADVKVSLLDPINGPIGTHAYRSSSLNHLDELQLNTTLQFEGGAHPDVLIFSIKADTGSRLILNDTTSSADDRIVSINNGPEFTAICGRGHHSFDFSVARDLLPDPMLGETFDNRLLYETHAFSVSPVLHRILIEQIQFTFALTEDETRFDEALAEVALTLLAVLSKLDPISTSNRARIVNAAIKHIRKNVRERISPEQLADVAHCSIRTLQYAFRKTFGISPKQYVRRYRLNQFRRELLEPSDTGHEQLIGALAREYRFSHAGNLSKSYKELFGKLPSEGCTCGLHDHVRQTSPLTLRQN